MAKDKPRSPADVTPAFGEAFGSAPELSADVGNAEAFGPMPENADDSRDTEIARLKGEIDRLKAERAAPTHAGRRYQVALKDSATAIVECRDGEHPWDAYRRCVGVISSAHTCEASEVAADHACGVVTPEGKIRPFGA